MIIKTDLHFRIMPSASLMFQFISTVLGEKKNPSHCYVNQGKSRHTERDSTSNMYYIDYKREKFNTKVG